MPIISYLNPIRPFLQNPRLGAIGLIFFIHGLPLSTWFFYIPIVKDRLLLTEGQIGVALFCFALGAFTMMLASGRIIKTWGDGRVTFFATIAFCLILLFPLLAPTYLWLCISLYIAGLSAGLMDISMNAVASLLENQSGTYIMSGCHGFFSLGAMVGAGLGGIILQWDIHPALHMGGLIAPLLLLSFFLKDSFYSVRETLSKDAPSQWAIIPLAGLGFMCFGFMMSEGSIHDWSTIFMRDVKNTPLTYMGLGFAAFNGAMAFGRFYGDAIQERLSTLQIIYMGGLLALAGFAVILLSNWRWAIAGFACIGIGFSGMVPTLFRSAANREGISSAQGIATLAGVGYVGFLIGPVILGFIAEWYSLSSTFLFIFLLVSLSLLITPISLRSS